MNNNIDNALPAKTILHGNAYNYCIEKAIGRGSFGITYIAKVHLKGALGELQSDMTVAIKEFFMDNFNDRTGDKVISGSNSHIYRNYRRDFIREANNLAKCHHPNIVKVLEAFEENNTAYFSMEYIDGENLNDHILDKGQLSEREALDIIFQIGQALSLMHDNKMLHLDIKPLNIMLRKNGEAVLIDFGLSKQFSDNGEPESSTHIGAGTMGYAPLEQSNYKKENGFSPTLDIYALGATLFKELTGKTPPNASSILNDGFPEQMMEEMGISHETISLVSWAMEPMRRKRPQNITEFTDKVKQLLPTAPDNLRNPVIIEPQRAEKPTETDTEICNGFHIHWANGLTEGRKSTIRDMLTDMRKLYEKKYIYGTAAHPENISYPIYYHAYFNKYIYQLDDKHQAELTGDGYRLCIRDIIELVCQLEEWTSLPFRLPTYHELNLIYGKTNFNEDEWIEAYINDIVKLYYSQENGLSTIGINKVGLDKEVEPLRVKSLGVNIFGCMPGIILIIDGQTPAYIRWSDTDLSPCANFNMPDTQPIYTAIHPIGFSLYKIRNSHGWNIVSRTSPMNMLLPEYFDSISPINSWSIPAPGPSNGYDIFGIYAAKGANTTYFSFGNNTFSKIKTLSYKDIQRWDECT